MFKLQYKDVNDASADWQTVKEDIAPTRRLYEVMRLKSGKRINVIIIIIIKIYYILIKIIYYNINNNNNILLKWSLLFLYNNTRV